MGASNERCSFSKTSLDILINKMRLNRTKNIAAIKIFIKIFSHTYLQLGQAVARPVESIQAAVSIASSGSNRRSGLTSWLIILR